MRPYTKLTCTTLLCFWIALVSFSQSNRSIDGFGNNQENPAWGAAGSSQIHFGTLGFSDGISEPSGQTRPNPRFISNSLFVQNTLANDPMSLSAYCWAWGQFIDHDITLVRDNPEESLIIPIPQGDMYFDPQGTGEMGIPIFRSIHDPASGGDITNPRRFINGITSFIDASAVYGSDSERATWLRTFKDGKLKTSPGNLLPWNTVTGDYNSEVDPSAPEMAMPYPFVDKWFVAGDVRANENPILTSMHTIFTREHNRLCAELKSENPGWSDEQLYQHARKLVGGLMQAIAYEEWLPAMGIYPGAYAGYNPLINPGIMNEFSAAAYRYGHTTINSVLVRMDNQGNYLPNGDILLRDAFFNPFSLVAVNGIEPYLIGSATMVQQDFDCKMVDDLRNFLFGQPGSGGLDLVAVNIARGRERGLSDFNTVREDFGLEPILEFDQFSSDPLMNQALEFTYGNINNLDPWVGMLAENHMPDALFGHTAMTIIEKQFQVLRDGDRYFYENDAQLSQEEIDWIKATRLSDIIQRNSFITILPKNVFIAGLVSSTNGPLSQGRIDFKIYPNPVEHMLFLRIPSDAQQTAQIQITDLNGKIVHAVDAVLSEGNNTMTLTLPPVCIPGTYALTISTGSSLGQQTFIKI